MDRCRDRIRFVKVASRLREACREQLAGALKVAGQGVGVALLCDRRRVHAYDNAVAESFFATLKTELIHRRSWPTRRELGSAVFEYIEAFYNRDRRHSTLGMHSPAEYEQLLHAAKASDDHTINNTRSRSVV